jgi:hypothetical protein
MLRNDADELAAGETETAGAAVTRGEEQATVCCCGGAVAALAAGGGGIRVVVGDLFLCLMLVRVAVFTPAALVDPRRPCF